MSVSVLVPRSPGSCTHRDAAWGWLKRRWAALHPTWEIVEGTAPAGRWCKAAAVADALDRATGDVLVIADADLIVDPAAISRSADAAVLAGWAVPFHSVRRLNQAATALVLACDPTDQVDLPRDHRSLARGPVSGRPGGGIFTVTRAAWDDVGGFDPRFVGWGGEDVSVGYALATLVGPAARVRSDLYHLWHPPQRDRRPGRAGHHHSLQLRYMRAKHDPAAMRALIEEVNDAPSHR